MLALFFIVWVVFNGRLTLEIALFGVAVSVAMFGFICKFMDYTLEKESRFYKKLPVFCQYLYYLTGAIIASNLTVARMILTRKEQMEPVLVHVHAELKAQTARVMLANAITLTPGTITVAMTDEDLLVHCLDKSLSEGMEDSVFVRILQKLEGV